MRQFIQTGPLRREAQALQVVHDGRLFRLAVHHVTLDCAKTETGRRVVTHTHSHHDAFHVVLYTEGDTDFIFGGRPVPGRSGTLALSPPGDSHDFGPAARGALTYSEVTFGLYDADENALAVAFGELLGAHAGLPLPAVAMPRVLDARQAAELLALLARILDPLESRAAVAQMQAQLAVGEVFAFLVRELFAPTRAGASQGEGGLAAARAHIESRYRERIAVAELARMAHLSPGYFLRAFKRAHGVTPIAYQGCLRVEAARTLLRFSNLACKEIALRLGFHDVYHFSKSFRKAVGVPPSAFRRGVG